MSSATTKLTWESVAAVDGFAKLVDVNIRKRLA
jgi:hypothetical protein